MVKRFSFFQSYYESMEELPPEDFKAVLCAICRYAFYGEEAELTGVQKVVYTLIKPSIDKSMKMAENGGKGARSRWKKEEHTQAESKEDAIAKLWRSDGNDIANEWQTDSQPIASEWQTHAGVGVGVGVGEGKGKRKRNKGQEVTQTGLVNDANLPAPLKDKLLEWLRYKKERREGYKETGLKSLLTQVAKYEQQYGATAVMDLIDECMANGWRGIIWDRLNTVKKPVAKREYIKSDYDIDAIEKALIRN